MNFPESALSPSADLTLTDLQWCSKFNLDRLPAQSNLKVLSPNDATLFWTIGDGRSIVYTSPGLDNDYGPVKNVQDLPDGAKALIPIALEFVKMDHSWNRLALEAVNIQPTGQPVQASHRGFGDFMEIIQSVDPAGTAKIQSPLNIILGAPHSMAEDGAVEESGKPAFPDIGSSADRKMTISIRLNVGGQEPVTYTSRQYTIWRQRKSISRGTLATYAAITITQLLEREKGRRRPLCVNNMEIHPSDVLLVKLTQVSQGNLQAEIAVRKSG